MKTIDEIKKIWAQHEAELKQNYKVRSLGIFGSVVRGEHGKSSDVDILAEFEDGADFLHLVGLALFLEEKLNRKIDVVPKRTLRREIRDSVLKEVVPL